MTIGDLVEYREWNCTISSVGIIIEVKNIINPFTAVYTDKIEITFMSQEGVVYRATEQDLDII
jgi:hypothetical protein